MKVSVCMITYNHERFLAQALEGVLMQQTDFEFEIVIGEDRSTDGTRAIVEDYARRYPRKIRAFPRETNIGMMPNLIETLGECKGEFVAMLEGDDYWTDPLKLARQAALMDSLPAMAFCYHPVTVVAGDGSLPPQQQPGPDKRIIRTLEDVLLTHYIPTCSVMFRRSLCPALPDWYARCPAGDWPLWVLLAHHGGVGYLAEVMGVYRVHTGGVWSLTTGLDQARRAASMIEMVFANLAPAQQRVLAPRVTQVSLWLANKYIEAGRRDDAEKAARTAFSFYRRFGGVTISQLCVIWMKVHLPHVHALVRWAKRWVHAAPSAAAQ